MDGGVGEEDQDVPSLRRNGPVRGRPWPSRVSEAPVGDGRICVVLGLGGSSVETPKCRELESKIVGGRRGCGLELQGLLSSSYSYGWVDMRDSLLRRSLFGGDGAQ